MRSLAKFCERSRRTHIRKLGKALQDRVLVSGVWVRTTTTPCHLGGHRCWFLCPACGRRCAILYPRQCRKCINGRYAVESMTPLDRKITKAIALRARLGQLTGGTLAPFPEKPKRMRRRTDLKLRARSPELEKEIWAIEGAERFLQVCGDQIKPLLCRTVAFVKDGQPDAVLTARRSQRIRSS